MKARRLPALFAVIAATVLSAAACSNSSSSTGAAGSPSTSAAGGSGSASATAAAGSSAPAASGKCQSPAGPTVTVMALLEEAPAYQVSQDSSRAAIAARVAAINCAGGLGAAGDKLAVTYCISNYDPNAVNACANQAVSDKSIIAVAGGGVAEGTPGAILASGGVPSIPQTSYSSDLSGTTTFAVVPSGVQLGPGEPVMACKLGYKKVSLLLIQNPAAAGVPAFDNKALEGFGCPDLIRTVQVPQNATDVSSQVVAAAQGADAIVLAVATNQAIAAFKDAKQLNIKAPFITNAGSMTSGTIQAAGSAANGVLVESQAFLPASNSSSAGAAQFRAEMAAVGKSNLVDGWSQGTWITFDLLQTAAKGLTTVDRASLLGALNKITSFDAGGQIPTVNFTKPAPDPAFPRLFNDQWSPAVVKNGQLVALENATLGNFVPVEKVG
jgi:ABC-type branched-subunit amino acid transport system substrate-binding protein